MGNDPCPITRMLPRRQLWPLRFRMSPQHFRLLIPYLPCFVNTRSPLFSEQPHTMSLLQPTNRTLPSPSRSIESSSLRKHASRRKQNRSQARTQAHIDKTPRLSTPNNPNSGQHENLQPSRYFVENPLAKTRCSPKSDGRESP